MTKQEAISEMMKGKKLTHYNFTPEEWVTIGSEGQYILEDGVECSASEFWQWRKDSQWLIDWELWLAVVPK